MTMADIKDVSITYSSALEIARAIDDKRLNFNGMCGTLENLVDDLSNQWVGVSQREFLAAYNKLKPKLKLISSTMERYSNEIRAAMAAEEEQDKKSSSGFKEINYWPHLGGSTSIPVRNTEQNKKDARSISEKSKDDSPIESQPETTSMQLHHNMSGYSVRQGDYSYFTQPYGYNAGCCAVAYAAGISIVTGQAYDPTQFWYDGYTHYDAGHKSGWQSYDSEHIYNELKSGHPFQLAYIYASSPLEQTDADHFVLITGIRDGADIKHLQYSDFIALDPATGSEVPLNESWKFNPDRVTGGFTIS